MVQFSNDILNRYGGNNLADLSVCGAQELPEKTGILDQAIWNHMFALALRDPRIMHLDVSILRRSATAWDEYVLGRSHLLQYINGLENRRHSITAYWSGLQHFEQCAQATWAAIELCGRLEGLVLKIESKKLSIYKQGDGSDLERLHLLVNVSKHFSPEQAAQSSSPVWITNDGLACAISKLSFDELRDNVLAIRNIAFDTFVVLPQEAAARSAAKLQ